MKYTRPKNLCHQTFTRPWGRVRQSSVLPVPIATEAIFQYLRTMRGFGNNLFDRGSSPVQKSEGLAAGAFPKSTTSQRPAFLRSRWGGMRIPTNSDSSAIDKRSAVTGGNACRPTHYRGRRINVRDIAGLAPTALEATVITGGRFGVTIPVCSKGSLAPPEITGGCVGGERYPHLNTLRSGGIENNASYDLSTVTGRLPLACRRISSLPFTDRLCYNGSSAPFRAGSQPQVSKSLPARCSGLAGEAGVWEVQVPGLPAHHPDPLPAGHGPGQTYIPIGTTACTSADSNFLTIYFREFRNDQFGALTTTQMPHVCRTRGRAPP